MFTVLSSNLILFGLARPGTTYKRRVKLQLHDPIYRLRFYSSSLIHILSLSNSHNNMVSIQKNRGDKSYRVIVALSTLLKRGR